MELQICISETHILIKSKAHNSIATAHLRTQHTYHLLYDKYLCLTYLQIFTLQSLHVIYVPEGHRTSSLTFPNQ